MKFPDIYLEASWANLQDLTVLMLSRGASPEPRPFEGDDRRHVAAVQVSTTSIYDELAALSFPPANGSPPFGQPSAVAVASLARTGRVVGVVDSAAMQPSSVGILARIVGSAVAGIPQSLDPLNLKSLRALSPMASTIK